MGSSGPLLAAVDQAMAGQPSTGGHLGEVIGEFASRLTFHLAREERDTLPLIGQTLTIGEWAGVQADIRARGSAAGTMEMVPWLLGKLPPRP